MYKRKTVDCYAIESFYEGYGWSIECNCEDLKDAKVQLKTYRENVNYPVRIKKWREKSRRRKANGTEKVYYIRGTIERQKFYN